MENNLKRLIREAFNTAFINHKTQALRESVQSLESKMSSGEIYNAENAFREITANPNLAVQYSWVPQGSANGKLTPKEFNLLTELIFEKTDPATKKALMLSLYGQNNKALYNKAAKKIMGTLKTNINPQTMENAYMEGWAQMFLDTQSKDPGVERKQNFDDLLLTYSPEGNGSFGAFIAEVLSSNILNAYREEMQREQGTVSINAPSQATGKETDLGSDDIGSDTLHVPDAEDTVRSAGGAFDSFEDSEEVDSSVVDLDSDEPEGPEDDAQGSTIGDDLENDDASPAEKNARKMIRILFLSLKQGIKEFRETENPSEAQERGLAALEMLMNTGEEPDAVSAKLGYKADGAINDLKKNKRFVKMVDDYLFTNGVLDPRGKRAYFENMRPLFIAKASNFMRTGDVNKLAGLQEGIFPELDEFILEAFLDKNMSVIMERVYKRLKKNGK